MPLVSLIVPCLNEERTIRLLLDGLLEQTILGARRDPGGVPVMEVVIADGLSTDRTREAIQAFAAEHPELPVRVVDNPKRHIPAALNRAIAAASGRYIVRLDAHSVPSSDYVERCVEALETDRGENVGGVWEIRPFGDGPMERAIAVAAGHRLGVGDARYRYTSEAGFVDTVPFGAFKRETLERLGAFDESLLTNEDYELNTRVRRGGGRVWLDPRIRCTYFARPNLAALAKQYWRYGYWKLQMLRRYPTTLRWRQALPPAFVLGVLGLALAGLAWTPAWKVLAGLLAFYALTLVAGVAPAVRKQGGGPLYLAVPLAIATMHLSWGAGFLVGLVAPPR